MKTREIYEKDPLVEEAVRRGFIEIHGSSITYNVNQKKTYNWDDPEEWVRSYAIAYLILIKKYAPKCIRTEVVVPRRTPNDLADVVVYSNEKCKEPYLVVETKKESVTDQEIQQAIEQLFGNANSLRAPIGLLDYGEKSI